MFDALVLLQNILQKYLIEIVQRIIFGRKTDRIKLYASFQNENFPPQTTFSNTISIL